MYFGSDLGFKMNIVLIFLIGFLVMMTLSFLVLVGLIVLISKLPQGAPGQLEDFSGDGIRVACIGDSITHGRIGVDWVQHLRVKRGGEGFEFINGGINGHVVAQVNQRLDDILQHEPDVAILLIGTNDVMGSFDLDDGLRYQKNAGLDSPPSFEGFKESYLEVLEKLSIVNHVAVCTLPPVGEELESPINQLVDDFNQWIIDTASDKDISVLPFNARLKILLEQRTVPLQQSYSADRFTKVSRILKASFSFYFLNTRWDDWGNKQGQQLIFDQIHIGEKAGEVLEELVDGFIGHHI